MQRSKVPGLFDHLVGAGEQYRRNLEPDRLGGLQIEAQLEASRRLHGQRDTDCRQSTRSVLSSSMEA